MAFATGNTIPKISDFKHRVALCTMKDVVLDGSTMELRREAVVWCWAYIEHQSHLASYISPMGYAAKENPERPTHKICVRDGLSLEYSSAAWVYETRLRSPPRWYKVLGFVEKDHFVHLDTHLVQKNDDIKPMDETNPLAPARQDVVL